MNAFPGLFLACLALTSPVVAQTAALPTAAPQLRASALTQKITLEKRWISIEQVLSLLSRASHVELKCSASDVRGHTVIVHFHELALNDAMDAIARVTYCEWTRAPQGYALQSRRDSLRPLLPKNEFQREIAQNGMQFADAVRQMSPEQQRKLGADYQASVSELPQAMQTQVQRMLTARNAEITQTPGPAGIANSTIRPEELTNSRLRFQAGQPQDGITFYSVYLSVHRPNGDITDLGLTFNDAAKTLMLSPPANIFGGSGSVRPASAPETARASAATVNPAVSISVSKSRLETVLQKISEQTPLDFIADTDVSRSPLVTLSADKTPLRDVLDGAVAQTKGFRWQQARGGTIVMSFIDPV